MVERTRLDDDTKERYSEVPDHDGDTVTIACKMPNGLILRNFDMVPDTEMVMGGGVREIKKAVLIDGSEWRVNGTALDIEKLKKNILPDYLIVSGYALTPGVPKIIWERWLEANKTSPLVKNGLIFAHKTEASARSQAHDHKDIRSGLEPLDPENPSKSSKEFSKIKKFDRKEEAA